MAQSNAQTLSPDDQLRMGPQVSEEKSRGRKTFENNEDIGGARSEIGNESALSSRLRKIKSIDRRLSRLSEDKAKDESFIDSKIKWASTKVLNYLWGLTASVYGFIPGFLALNILAFLKITGIVNKIKLRLIDKIGLALLDFIVFFIVMAVLAILVWIADNILFKVLSTGVGAWEWIVE
jgi:hypothetical protein